MTLHLEDQRFGRLVTLHRVASHTTPNGRKHARWRCACDCGGTVEAFASGLKSGRTKDCGCVRREQAATLHQRRPVHRSTRLEGRRREYGIWKNIVQRCTNPKNPSFKHYGARGIGIHKAWRLSFDAFFQAIGPIPQGRELDRVNNNRGYEPGNVRVTTRSVNMKNARLRWRERERDPNGRFK